MATFKVFYAWQSDRPANLCRRLIRSALDDAAKQLEGGLEIEDAPPIDVEIDQDTQGEAGSPPVAETILQKIRESDAFVADLTFTGCRTNEQESPVPNPNVLIEFGYALGILGHQRIITVFNEEFGSCNDLPFDLKHRRWPIRYRTSGDRSDEQSQQARSAERKKLAKELANAIRFVVQNAGPRQGGSGSEAILPPEVDLDSWDEDSLNRWQNKIKNLPAGDGKRHEAGYWTVSFLIEGFNRPSIGDLKVALERKMPDYSGWPPFAFEQLGSMKPQPQGTRIEAWYPDLDAEYWCVSNDGRGFMLRGMAEDSETYYSNRWPKPKGPSFDRIWPISNMTEVMKFLEALAGEFASADSRFWAPAQISWNQRQTVEEQ